MPGRSRYERAQDCAKKRVNSGLLTEDAAVARERRPSAAAPVRMAAIDDDQQRPRGEVLSLEDDDSRFPAAYAEALEGHACGGAVGEVDREPDGAPVTPRERSAEQAHVRKGGAEETLGERLGGGPGCCRDRPG
jgi:hypothetical protein